MITRKADYAIRIVEHLSMPASRHRAVSATTIAQAMRIPYLFLRAIVHELKQAGILRSTRGRTGGLLLARPAARISVADVVQAVDAHAFALNACLHTQQKCWRARRCPLHGSLKKLQRTIHTTLAGIRFDRLAARAVRARRRGVT
jgi:Rrf2 family protein